MLEKRGLNLKQKSNKTSLSFQDWQEQSSNSYGLSCKLKEARTG